MHPPTEAAIEPSTSTGPESLGTVRVTVTSDGRLPVFNMAQADASGPALPDCQAPLCDHWQTRMGASTVMINRRRRKGTYTGSGWADSARSRMARPAGGAHWHSGWHAGDHAFWEAGFRLVPVFPACKPRAVSALWPP